MIYKFMFEVCSDKNELISLRSEESGSFWWAFTKFMQFVMGYAETMRR